MGTNDLVEYKGIQVMSEQKSEKQSNISPKCVILIALKSTCV